MTTSMPLFDPSMMDGKESLVFIVTHIIFQKDGWCVTEVKGGDKVVGNFAPKLNQCYRGIGTWVTTKYGPQFKLERAEAERHTSARDLAQYLTYHVDGVGKGAIDMLAELGDQLEQALDRADVDLLTEAVGRRRATKLIAHWPTLKPAADLVSPLLGYGLSEALATRLVSSMGKDAVHFVETQPYSLINMVDGVAFLTADRIARGVGIRATDPTRLKAGLAFGLKEATGTGNLGIPRAKLLQQTMLLVNPSTKEGNRRVLTGAVEVPEATLAATLDEMLAKGDCPFALSMIEEVDGEGVSVIWSQALLQAEEHIARRLVAFKARPLAHMAGQIDAVAKEMGMVLAEQQREAVVAALMSPVSVLTGGPGCGKSATLKVIFELFRRAGLKGNQVAPTGKAAKRISQSTGLPAQTMHSLFLIQGSQSGRYNEGDPLPVDYLAIDEMSMSDTEATCAVLQSLPNTCRILLVGDVDQLDSVGPGQVLRDIIRAGVFPVTRLTKVFRFGGGIIEAAAKIRQGQLPETTDDGQFVHVETETPATDILTAVQALLEDGVSADDIQVLAPFHKGEAGCTSLNQKMQALLNPEEPGAPAWQRIKRDEGDIRPGDRVIQNKNDREAGLVNGDVGWIAGISTDGVELMLADSDKNKRLTTNQTGHLRLGYAITVHKSQGAEAPYVLIALDPAGGFMLRRNLIYTAATRGSKRVMVFGPRRTLELACRQGSPAEGTRRTKLVQRLREWHARVAPAVEPMADVPF